MVGNPNVGKSSLFNLLSESYVDVSNYAGTTVEITKALTEWGHLIDTPGAYSISSFNEEEKVTQEELSSIGEGDFAINVVNAQSLEKDLFLTLHLIDLSIPFIFVINQIDELEASGSNYDLKRLEMILGVKIFPVSCRTGEGVSELKKFLQNHEPLAKAIESIDLKQKISKFKEEYSVESSFEALMLLEGDARLHQKFKVNFSPEESKNQIYHQRRERVDRIVKLIVKSPPKEDSPLQKKLDSFLMHPVFGSLFGVFVGFIFLYQVLGVMVSGSLVNFLENNLLDRYWTSPIRWTVAQVLPVEISPRTPSVAKKWKISLPIDQSGLGILTSQNGLTPFKKEFEIAKLKPTDLNYVFGPQDGSPGQTIALKSTFWSALGTVLVGKYGVLTLAVTYLFAVLLPLVWFFYLSWSLMEDSGYLPRLAVLADGFMRRIGLNGRGVIPLVLGLGCVTMAMVTTRLMKNRREQLIMMVLLSIAIPCSAQLAIIQGLLAKVGGLVGWLIWAGTIISVLALTGLAANFLIKGKGSGLILEIPPLRVPQVKNVFRKTYTKTIFFMKEAGLAFFITSFVLALCQISGLLDWVIVLMKPAVSGILHLPEDVAISFLLGMVRRDFGAFGLLEIPLNIIQVITVSVALTLFVPCIATLGVMIKERGFFVAVGIWLLSWVLGFGIAGILSRFLEFIRLTV